MGKAIDEYHLGATSVSIAKAKLIEASSESHIQNLFWGTIHSRNEIRSYDKLVFSQNLVDVYEEKNRCHMERTGLSYAKYPKWEYGSQRISQLGTVALTDSGIYILDAKSIYIPYSRIIDVGVNTPLLRVQEVYFEVKTTSPYRHRYSICAGDRKDKNLAVALADIIRLMIGLKDTENRKHLVDTPPSTLSYLFTLYPSEPEPHE